MDKVEIQETSAGVIPDKYKLEVTKNTKGYNWVVTVRGDDLEVMKKDMLDLEAWAKENYST